MYEGLLSRSAQESPKGAGQYFTSGPLIKAIADVMQPSPEDTVCDPACGTAGFLLCRPRLRRMLPAVGRVSVAGRQGWRSACRGFSSARL
ncbi:MAG: N-6 DNA methylase [Thermoleophilia bacterium]